MRNDLQNVTFRGDLIVVVKVILDVLCRLGQSCEHVPQKRFFRSRIPSSEGELRAEQPADALGFYDNGVGVVAEIVRIHSGVSSSARMVLAWEVFRQSTDRELGQRYCTTSKGPKRFE